MRIYSLLVLGAMAACNTPPVGFAGVEPVRVTVGQSVFDVRVKNTRAHALRVNSEFALNFGAVAPRALIAIKQVSGCQIVDGSLMGDAVFITADLLC
ncbi:hypothetical protein [Yoonia sp.]|uniref:hypothetical protein n=1 Tax=Yoonia sp. TaxID=2212373 RepID=UPI001A0DF54A|nr:hypothetical protein [Yoonia sp.]MBE0414558.1 hypothetical protein [Yoonia sp.]